MLETRTGSTALESAQTKQSARETMMNAEYNAALIAYRTSMSLAAGLLSDGIITEKEYDKIDRIIAKKYGLSLGSICCRKPLIALENRGNMRHTEGGESHGEIDPDS